MSKEKTDEKFRRDAKSMVDSLFDNDLFKERITRSDMNSLEDWISKMMSMSYESEKEFQELMESINKSGQTK